MPQQLSIFDQNESPSQVASRKSHIANRQFICLDIEATGLNPENEKVIEIALVKFDDNKIIDTYQTLINPERDVPEEITHLTGIKSEDLYKAPKIGEVKNKIKEFIGDLPVVGHFIEFDINFLNYHGFNFNNIQLDTYELAKIILPSEESYNLEVLGHKFHITHENAHRALDDVLACIELLKILQEQIRDIADNVWPQINHILKKGQCVWAEEFLFWQNKSLQSSDNDFQTFFPNQKTTTKQQATESDVLDIECQALNKNFIGNQPVIFQPSYYLDIDKFIILLKQEVLSPLETIFCLKMILVIDKFQKSYSPDNPDLISKKIVKLFNEEKNLWQTVSHDFYSLLQTKFWRQTQKNLAIMITHEFLYELIKANPVNFNKMKSLRICNPDLFIKHLLSNVNQSIYLNNLLATGKNSANLNNNLTILFGLLGIFYEKLFGTEKSEQEIIPKQLNDISWQQIKKMIENFKKIYSLPLKITTLLDLILNIDFDNYVFTLNKTEKSEVFLKFYPKNFPQKISLLNNYFSEIETHNEFPLSLSENCYIQHFLDTKININDKDKKTEKNQIFLSDIEQILSIINNQNDTDYIFISSSERNSNNLYTLLFDQIDKENTAILAQQVNGSIGKIQELWAQNTSSNRILILKYENLHSFLFKHNKKLKAQVVLIIYNLPFDYMKNPVNKISSAKFKNTFLEFAIPRVTLEIKNIINSFSKIQNRETQTFCLDRRIQNYNNALIENLSTMSDIIL
ncbi:hypothetical protein A2307_03590 [Candidatus Peregrinibacteria bacterium RIFOXYB2_FULL_33_20]|nr:MAG: hypothetical protein A2307_03590 [Candidatus Peregrinibacteria bacterium RIFOXYB2_FULL_33_20]